MNISTFMRSVLILIYCLGLGKCFNYNIVRWNRFERNLGDPRDVASLDTLKNFIFDETISYRNNDYTDLNLHGGRLHLINIISRRGIFDLNDDDHKARGSMGEIWEALSEFLNFTFQITDSDLPSYEMLLTHLTYDSNCTSLRGTKVQGECKIVPFIGIDRNQLDTLESTNCFFKDGNQLYIRPDDHFKYSWMMDIYTLKVWFSIFLLYSILIVVCIATNHLDSILRSQNQIFHIVHAFFACFGTLCNQGAELGMILKYRAVLFCTYMLSWVLITCFSSQIYVVMTRSILVPPFWSLETLFRSTDYTVLVENSSAAFRVFQERHEPIMGQILDARRVEFHKGFKTLWDKACSYDRRNAAYHFAYQYPKNVHKDIECVLEPTGESKHTTCIAALVPKDFIYRKSVDYGIIRLHEFGIISAAKSRWIGKKTEAGTRPYSPIILEQIYFPLSVYSLGSCFSVIILMIERILRHEQLPVQHSTRKRTR